MAKGEETVMISTHLKYKGFDSFINNGNCVQICEVDKQWLHIGKRLESGPKNDSNMTIHVVSDNSLAMYAVGEIYLKLIPQLI